MKLTIFSDAVCTWSYGEEKVLRAIDYIYCGKIEMDNIMAGMISDYHDILPMNMKDNDSDEMANKILLQIWQTGSNIHGMPIMIKAPNLLSRKNPSTNIIDCAFIAARITEFSLSNKFLRKLREATMLDGLNTMDENICADIAQEIGIDRVKFIENFRNFSKEEFLNDRIATFDRRMVTFPNFMYVDEKKREHVIRGYKTKNQLIEFIDKFSNLKKRYIVADEKHILDFIKQYKRVFRVELKETFDISDIDLDEILERLEKQEAIIKNEVGNGIEYKEK